MDLPRSNVGARTVVAVNAHASRSRDPEALMAAIVAAVAGVGRTPVGLVVDTEEDMHEAIAAAEGGRLVLAGGDGAVHFVLNAAPGPIELGLVPTGRANNIARALGVPRDVLRAARHAVESEARPVDVLRVETPERTLLGIEGVSAGLQAAARMLYDAPDSAHLLEGAGAFVSALSRYSPWWFELELDGRRTYDGEAAEVFLSNFPLFAYGFRVDPVADVSDGRLEAIVLEADSRPQVARLVLAAYRGTLGRQRNVTLATGREARILTPVPLVCDSDTLGTTTVSVRVEQGLLKVAA